MISQKSNIRCGLLVENPNMQWIQDWIRLVKVANICELQLLQITGQQDINATSKFPDAIFLCVTYNTMPWAQARLDQLRGLHTPIIAITEGLRLDVVQRLLQSGVDDFLTVHCDLQELQLRLQRLCEGWKIQADAEDEATGRDLHPALSRIIGSSDDFRKQLERLPIIAESGVDVLILGETGTGKELFAQATHYLSRRSKNPWVALNCGGLPPDLVESELFGHVRGAYTSADRNYPGLAASAEGGTLFLDEISSLPLAAQSALLRFLQEKEYRAVGSASVTKSDVRIIAASNSDLNVMVDRGQFRKDLYYRLNVLTIMLPPLRERLDDLLPLTEHFVKHYAREFRRPVTKLSTSAVEGIVRYNWPGNVRELEHCIKRAVLLCRYGRIESEDLELPTEHMLAREFEPFKKAKSRAVERFERLYIERMLLLNGGNISRAAAAASKNRRAFWEVMRKHHIDANRFRRGASEV